MSWSASSSLSSRSHCSPSHSFVCRTQQGLIRARGIPIGGRAADLEYAPGVPAPPCARRDYFSPLSSSRLQRGKIVPSRARARSVNAERIPDMLHAAARPDLRVIFYIPGSKSPVWNACARARADARASARSACQACSERNAVRNERCIRAIHSNTTSTSYSSIQY